jgi:hypothetical protein
MFEVPRNTGDDHFGASSDLIPEHSPLINLDSGDGGGDNEYVSSEEEEVTPPPNGKGKKTVGAENDKGKRPKKVLDNGCKIKSVKLCHFMRDLQRQLSQWWQERRRTKDRPLRK